MTYRRAGGTNEQYLTKDEMEKLSDNRLLRYFRAVKNTAFKQRQIYEDPTVLDRIRAAKITSREILIRRGVIEKPKTSGPQGE